MSDAAEAWESFEAQWYAREQARVNRVRIHGYTLACAERVKVAHKELDRRVTLLVRARNDAERALEALRAELSHAEQMAAVVIEDDEDVNELLARRLEQLESEELGEP